MYPPRKDPIPNQYINRLITKQYPSLPPVIEKHPSGYKPLFHDTHDPNGIEDDPNDSTDNSRNKKEDSVNKMKWTNNENIVDKYKDENSAALKMMKVLSTKTKKNNHWLNAWCQWISDLKS